MAGAANEQGEKEDSLQVIINTSMISAKHK
jgi:hypothetical protein